MFKYLFIFLALLGALYSGASYYIPQQLEERYLQSLDALGAEQAEYARKVKHQSVLHINGIKLDPDGFSFFPKTLIEYDVFNPFGFKETQTITLKQPRLSGELDKVYNLSLAGLSFQKPSPLPLSFETLILEDASLELFSEIFGGVTLIGTLRVQNEESGLSFSAPIQSIQRRLGFDARLDGTITKEQMDVMAKIQGLRLETDIFRGNRGSGEVELNGAYPDDLNLQGVFEFGGISLYGYGFSGVSVKLKKLSDILAFEGSGHASNFEEIKLNFTHQTTVEKTQSKYEISAPDSDILLAYLQNYDGRLKIFDHPDVIDDISVTFDLNSEDPDNILVNILEGEKTIFENVIAVKNIDLIAILQDL